MLENMFLFFITDGWKNHTVNETSELAISYLSRGISPRDSCWAFVPSVSAQLLTGKWLRHRALGPPAQPLPSPAPCTAPSSFSWHFMRRLALRQPSFWNHPKEAGTEEITLLQMRTSHWFYVSFNPERWAPLRWAYLFQSFHLLQFCFKQSGSILLLV